MTVESRFARHAGVRRVQVMSDKAIIDYLTKQLYIERNIVRPSILYIKYSKRRARFPGNISFTQSRVWYSRQYCQEVKYNASHMSDLLTLTWSFINAVNWPSFTSRPLPCRTQSRVLPLISSLESCTLRQRPFLKMMMTIIRI